jgi:type IV secretory pathway VirB6-like protein
MFIGLLTIMVVWVGVQEALSSAQGGAGLNIAKGVEFVLVASLGLTMIQFYEAPIPGVGFGFKNLVVSETTYLSTVIGNDGLQSIHNLNNNLQSSLGSAFFGSLDVYRSVVQFAIQVMLGFFSAISIAVVGYGMVAAAICGLLGPIFIPFFIVPRLSFLFWGWFRAFLGFSFYKVVAAATLNILGHLYVIAAQGLVPITAGTLVVKLPVLVILVALNIYILFKVPAITNAILSGHPGGGGGGGLGLLALARFL